MTTPRRRFSTTRRDKRRTHVKTSPPAVSVCEQCGEPKQPHRACMSCGYYKGREVIEIKEE